ncbi:MAG: FtsX-like permease family protein, partial [Planctomycetota bacterium]
LAHAPGRAFSVAAIVAVAEFLIVAVSAFSLAPPARPHEHSSPTGGWTFIATFAEPTGIDPSDANTRASLGLSDDAERALADCTFARLRASTGDDASCTNLYAAKQPTVLGLPPGFIKRGGFAFTSHAPLESIAGEKSPWQLLERVPAGGSGQTPIPAILDEATARWALKLGGVGARFQLPDGTGGTQELEIVGLLQPGILQGYVLVGERSFERLFPRSSGYAMALVDAGSLAAGAHPDDAAKRRVAAAIGAAWADAGVTVQPALNRLRSLSAVQNTFLAGFQALGTLGLLLGTAGVGAVQIQGVLERKRLFGLLQAVGFSRGRLALLVVLETLFMVGLGLASGALAGAATLPAHAASGRVGLPLGWLVLTCGLTLVVALLAGLAACGGVLSVEPRETLSDA